MENIHEQTGNFQCRTFQWKENNMRGSGHAMIGKKKEITFEYEKAKWAHWYNSI